LRASAERERAERERLQLEQQEARDAAQAAVEHAAALEDARRELEHAISGVREARRAGSGVAASDAAWRQAKARLIELETGAPPEWARHEATDVREVDGEDGDSS
jgi:sugar (pentulose or hexulose) kinase